MMITVTMVMRLLAIVVRLPLKLDSVFFLPCLDRWCADVGEGGGWGGNQLSMGRKTNTTVRSAWYKLGTVS